jgi:hypothetical protein
VIFVYEVSFWTIYSVETKVVYFDDPQFVYDMNFTHFLKLTLSFSGVEFTKHAAQFIACVSACVVEMKRCEALEKTFEQADASYPLASPHIGKVLKEILGFTVRVQWFLVTYFITISLDTAELDVVHLSTLYLNIVRNYFMPLTICCCSFELRHIYSDSSIVCTKI